MSKSEADGQRSQMNQPDFPPLKVAHSEQEVYMSVLVIKVFKGGV